MGVISTPPKPAPAIASSSRVRLGLSTAEPSHHQRVQGLFSRVSLGHAVSGVSAARSALEKKTQVSRATSTRRVFMGGRASLRDGARAATEQLADSQTGEIAETRKDG